MEQAVSQPSQQETTGNGSTLLTEGVGTPQGAQLDRQETPAQPNGQANPNARPEWAPEKFWKDNKLDYEGLGKSYLSLEKLLGSEKIPVPRSDDDAEGWERYFKAGGKPEKADDYEFKVDRDKLPQNFYDEEAEKSFRQWAHANHLNKRQAANLHDAYVKAHLERHKAWEDNRKQTQAKLQTDLMREHGAGYEGFMKGAKGAISRYADPDFMSFLDESGLGNDPRMIRAFGRIGKEMMGDTRIAGAAKPTINVADLDASISDYRKQHQTALMDKSHPDHDRHVAHMAELYRKRYPDQQ